MTAEQFEFQKRERLPEVIFEFAVYSDKTFSIGVPLVEYNEQPAAELAVSLFLAQALRQAAAIMAEEYGEDPAEIERRLTAQLNDQLLK
jgi:hypothetical protein